MNLKEIKKIVAFAKKSGVKTLKLDGFEIELNDEAFNKPLVKAIAMTEDKVPFPEHREPTLEDINEYIYGDHDEVINN